MQVGKKCVVVMQPVLLRRTKTSTIDGEPVVKLPPREQQLVCKAFSASEQRFYDQVQQESMQKLKVRLPLAVNCWPKLVQSGTPAGSESPVVMHRHMLFTVMMALVNA